MKLLWLLGGVTLSVLWWAACCPVIMGWLAGLVPSTASHGAITTWAFVCEWLAFLLIFGGIALIMKVAIGRSTRH